MDFTKEELELLADGLNPRYVREGLDFETVIVALAKFALAVGSLANMNKTIAKREIRDEGEKK
jgi:hypothetical protein